MLDEIKKIKSDRKNLREFGLTIGIILAILGCVALWRGKPSAWYLLPVGLSFMVFGLLLPEVLKPLQKLWMAFALILGFFMSHIILVVLFYAVITPIGLMVKMFGKDILDQRIDKDAVSYWVKRSAAKKTRESYENQY